MINLTFYTDNLPETFGGCTNGFIIRIRPKYKDDAGIHRHEQEHVDQFWSLWLVWAWAAAMVVIVSGLPVVWYLTCLIGCDIHPLLYRFSRTYRLHSEACAYAVQLEPNRSNLQIMAKRLTSPIYDLNLTVAQAEVKILANL